VSGAVQGDAARAERAAARRARLAAALLASALLLLLSVGKSGGQSDPALPDSAALEAQTRALASQLRCVVCQGLSIQDSPSELAREMRALIREQLAAGRTPEEVKAYFVSRYGEWILLEPEPRGLNLAVYLLPLAALAAGAAIVATAVRRWTRPAAPDAGPARPEGPTAVAGDPDGR